MNQKKAKKLRQLVHHLMDSEKVSPETWVNYGVEKRPIKVSLMNEGVAPIDTCRLDPTCGRAIYQMMKTRAPSL